MARILNRLTAAGVKTAGPGHYADGGGLWLRVRDTGSAQWILRYTVHGRRREMGLGSAATVGLKRARDAADHWRDQLRRGRDPIRMREAERQEAARNLHILEDIAADAFESRKAELKGDGKAGRWFTPLQLHIIPRLGRIPVSELNQRDIRDALAPIWHEKADTARKALNRLHICLRHAAALGLEVDLQAPDKARALLGRQRHTPQNVPAMAWRDVPAFYTSLDEGSVTQLALRFLILTGARSAPVRFLHEEQLEEAVWTIPAERMKGRRDATRDFRVPLSTEALRVVEAARRHARDGFLFPNMRKGVISDAAMSRLMERRGVEARPHGFRSSLRDWIAETTRTPHDIAEMVLGHSTGSSVERAYRRTDFLEQRRVLMERWARHLTGPDLGEATIAAKKTS